MSVILLSPGHCKDGRIFVAVKDDTKSLSFRGVIGPLSNGDSRGSCGQIIMSYKEYDSRGYMQLHAITPCEGWSHERIRRLFDLWNRWHMNDMRAGCEHQRAEGWDKRPIDPEKPLTAWGRHFMGQEQNSWNMLAWVRPDEHPDGLLTKPCSVCGYKYGTSWLFEPIPVEVVHELKTFPRVHPSELPDSWKSFCDHRV